jgi:AAA family ATP:ADP antiporter
LKAALFDRILRRVVDVRPGERPFAVRFFLYFFLITFPAYIIKPVKLSLLIGSFKPGDYPYAYLLSAALIGFVATLNARLLERLPRRRYLAGTLLFFMSNLILFWFLLRYQWPGLSLIYWFWSDVFIATTVTQFWIAVNDVFNPHQLKRLIGFMVSGGLLGGICGSLLAGRLAKLIGTANLLLVCPGVLVLTFVVVESLYHRREKAESAAARPVSPAEKRPVAAARRMEGFRILRGNRYLSLLGGVLTLAVIVGTLIELQFNTILQGALADKDARTAFIATFYGALLIVSYLFQVFISGPLLRRFGIRVALAFGPVLLLAASLSIFFIPAGALLGWAVAARGTDKGMDNTLNQSVRELLYIPVPAAVKYKAKLFIDMFVTKFANGVGALIFLVTFTAFGWPVRRVSVLSLGLVAVWLVLVHFIRLEYLRVVKQDLERRWEDGHRLVDERVDLDMTRLVFDTLQSREKSSALYLMNLFDLVGTDKLTPELKKLISSQAEEFRLRSLDSVLDVGAEASGLEVGDLLEDADWQRNIHEILELDSYRKVMDGYLQDTLSGANRADEVSRMEAAKLLGMRGPSPASVRALKTLLADPSAEVLNYAIASAARFRKKELLPALIGHLANPQIRQVAADALLAYGERALPVLKTALEDGRRPPELRRALPDVLARIGTGKAADLLLGEVERKKTETIEAELIEALFRLKSRNPELRFREKRILPLVLDQIRKSARLFLELCAAPSGTSCPDVRRDVRMALALKRIFELLSLVYPTEDIVRAYQNLLTGTERSADYSLEVLDNILNKEIRDGLAPLVEAWPVEERIRRCRKVLGAIRSGRREGPSQARGSRLE